MRNDQTGEYELVVGNPQLLSGFVIVVLLCAAAFVMGYEVGQNTPRSAKQADVTTPVSPQTPQVSTPAPVSQPAESSPAPQTDANPAQPVTEPPPQPTTQPARDIPATAAPAPAAAVQTPAPAATAMAPGSYCQVMAVRQASAAQSLLQTLKDGGMPASLQAGSDGWVRVMVGPYADRSALSSAKTELENHFQIRSPICR
jgi:cell division septation protein DedD